MHFNFYSVPPLVTAIINLCLGIVVYSRNKGSPVNRSFFLLSLSIVVWLFAASITYNCSQKELAMIFIRISHLGVAYIPIAMFQFIVTFLNIPKLKKLAVFFYFYGLICSALFLFTNILTRDCRQYFWGFYSLAGRGHPAFLVIFISTIILCVYLLLAYYLKSKEESIRKQQIKYVLIGIFIFDFSSVDFISNYGISFYPFGYATTTLFAIIFAYSIVKYRLLDISIAITRTGIFIAVYSLVLGIPFALAFGWREELKIMLGDSWWMVPLVTSTILATIGPFIYLYIQTRAEDRLFQEQRRYQATLRQASTGMGKIKDLKKLVTLIVHIMTRTVRVEYSMVFLNDSHLKIFRLGAYRSRQVRGKFRGDIGYDTAIVKTLQETQNPIVYDEVKQRAQDYSDFKLSRLETEMKALDASLVVPSFIDEKLLAILVMGSKVSGKIYSSDDLAVFSILANQSALAIENAQFYEDMKLTTAQLMKAEKMATIGIMADGLSHQINNRLHAMGFIAGDALDTLKIKNNLPMSLEVKEVMLDMEHALNRIESNVQQGGEIVQGLLKYTRKGEEGMTQVALDKLVAAALEMTQFKIKPGELIVNQDFSKDVPKIHGNFTQLQEVFFNMIDNAYDAMMQRKSELKEPNYAPTIKITAKAGTSRNLEIVFEDNGIGIRDEDKEKIFTPFFTTKLSSKKGTGLGLYVIQRLIEENHKGTVKYESKFKQGTKVYISLPT